MLGVRRLLRCCSGCTRLERNGGSRRVVLNRLHAVGDMGEARSAGFLPLACLALNMHEGWFGTRHRHEIDVLQQPTDMRQEPVGDDWAASSKLCDEGTGMGMLHEILFRRMMLGIAQVAMVSYTWETIWLRHWNSVSRAGYFAVLAGWRR